MKTLRNLYKEVQEKIKAIPRDGEFSIYYQVINYSGSRTQASNVTEITKLLNKQGYPHPIEEKDLRIFRAYMSLDKRVCIENLTFIMQDLEKLGIDIKSFKQEFSYSISIEENLVKYYEWAKFCKKFNFQNEIQNMAAKIQFDLKNKIKVEKNIEDQFDLLKNYLNSDLVQVDVTEDLLRDIFSKNKIIDIENDVDQKILAGIKDLLVQKNISGRRNIDKILQLNIQHCIRFIKKPPRFIKKQGTNTGFDKLIFDNLSQEELHILILEFNEIKALRNCDNFFLKVMTVSANNTNPVLEVSTRTFLKPLAFELQDRAQELDLFTRQEYDELMLKIRNLQQGLEVLGKPVKICANNLVFSDQGNLLVYRMQIVDMQEMKDISVISKQIKSLSLDN